LQEAVRLTIDAEFIEDAMSYYNINKSSELSVTWCEEKGMFEYLIMKKTYRSEKDSFDYEEGEHGYIGPAFASVMARVMIVEKILENNMHTVVEAGLRINDIMGQKM
jgi:ribonuclease HIII